MKINGVEISNREEALLRRLLFKAELDCSYVVACIDDKKKVSDAKHNGKSIMILKTILGLNN